MALTLSQLTGGVNRYPNGRPTLPAINPFQGAPLRPLTPHAPIALPPGGINKQAFYVPPPPSGLATDANVNAAYQNLMSYGAQADADQGTLRRNLQDTFDASKKRRMQDVLHANQNFADRGTLNSGVALGHDNDIQSNYDTLDRGYQNSYDDAIRAIARHKLDLSNAYQNSQLIAAHQMEVDKAKAAQDAIAAQQQAQALQDQQAALLAQLTPAPIAAPAFHPTTPVTKPKPLVVKSPIPKLTLKGPK